MKDVESVVSVGTNNIVVESNNVETTRFDPQFQRKRVRKVIADLAPLLLPTLSLTTKGWR